jgi:protein TonB
MPNYPRQALTLRREGAVVIHATVSEAGKVSQMKLMSGDIVLGRAAMDAIRQWRYRPAQLNGVPTASETDITLNFKLP